MGRALLILSAAALFSACRSDVPANAGSALADSATAAVDGHAGQTCASCHRGELADDRRASVPGEACTTAGCHEQRGPAFVSTATAMFPHRDHGKDSNVALSCAGCHTHANGSERLTVSVDACALCHLTDLNGGSADDCRLCHQQPNHIAQTKQSLPVPHSMLSGQESGCERCHYDVAEPAVRVARRRCASCHASDSTKIANGVGTDLHPDHVSVNCTSCHEGEAHHVRAMSSAVNLVCSDCHTSAHELNIANASVDAAVCNDCHVRVHETQQRLVLGLLPSEPPAPSAKFMAGLTCRSCHANDPQAAATGNPSRGHAASCTGCHPPEYGSVLRWWIDGTRARANQAGAYVTRAQSELGGASDSIGQSLRDVAALVDIVRRAGGQHNIELSDRVLRTSVE